MNGITNFAQTFHPLQQSRPEPEGGVENDNFPWLQSEFEHPTALSRRSATLSKRFPLIMCTASSIQRTTGDQFRRSAQQFSRPARTSASPPLSVSKSAFHCAAMFWTTPESDCSLRTAS